MAQLLTALAYLIPALLLLALLAHRRYPGERVLLAAIGTRRGRRRGRHLSSQSPARQRPRTLMPRGGRLIATALAVRPPPLLGARPN
jgi:hypothetical protein